MGCRWILHVRAQDQDDDGGLGRTGPGRTRTDHRTRQDPRRTFVGRRRIHESGLREGRTAGQPHCWFLRLGYRSGLSRCNDEPEQQLGTTHASSRIQLPRGRGLLGALGCGSVLRCLRAKSCRGLYPRFGEDEERPAHRVPPALGIGCVPHVPGCQRI